MKIGKAARTVGLSPHTLRYYDKEGLLCFVQRTGTGTRIFTEQDLEWLHCIKCLKETGMPLKDIKKFIELYGKGSCTIESRLILFRELRSAVKKQLELLNYKLELLDFKIKRYSEAAQNGAENFKRGALLEEFEQLRAKKD